MTAGQPVYGTDTTIPAELGEEMWQRCRTGEFDVKRLQRELSRRTGQWVPPATAEVLFEIYLGGDL